MNVARVQVDNQTSKKKKKFSKAKPKNNFMMNSIDSFDTKSEKLNYVNYNPNDIRTSL